jgi:hypothetical protein
MFTIRLLKQKSLISNLQMIIDNSRVLEHKKYQMQNQIHFSELNHQPSAKLLEKNEVPQWLLRSKPAY